MRFSGIILAGGRSSRMGTDKTMLKLQNKTLLEWQVEKLRSAGADEILLCGRSDIPLPNVRCIPDMLPNRGPLGGIYSGLLASRHPRVLVLSADVPLLPEETLIQLLTSHKHAISLLRHHEKLEPLIGVYDKNLADKILAIIEHNSAPVKALLDQCDWSTVEFYGDERLLCNCNTPEEYIAAVRIAEDLM